MQRQQSLDVSNPVLLRHQSLESVWHAVLPTKRRVYVAKCFSPSQLCSLCDCSDPSVVHVGFAWDSADERKMTRTFGPGTGRTAFGAFIDLQVRPAPAFLLLKLEMDASLVSTVNAHSRDLLFARKQTHWDARAHWQGLAQSCLVPVFASTYPSVPTQHRCSVLAAGAGIEAGLHAAGVSQAHAMRFRRCAPQASVGEPRVPRPGGLAGHVDCYLSFS